MAKKRKLWERPNYQGTPYQMIIRKAASYVTRPLLKTSITPNQVTLFALCLYIVPALLLYQQSIVLNIVGVLFFYIINILDKVDGQLAREKKMTSNTGIFIDGMLHNIGNVAIYVPLGLRFYQSHGLPALLAAFVSLVLVLLTSYNYLNRTYLVGSGKSSEMNKLKVSESLRSKRLLVKLYSFPNEHMPEILIVAIILGLLPYLLYAYVAYNAFSFLATAYILSRF